MHLTNDNRADFWKLDLNSDGWLPQNITPHGAPAVSKMARGVVGPSSTTAIIHYGYQYMNAIWDGAQMRFGDGDGTIFGDFTNSLEILAHVMTYDFISNTCKLVYQGQSGDVSERMGLKKKSATDRTGKAHINADGLSRFAIRK